MTATPPVAGVAAAAATVERAGDDVAGDEAPPARPDPARTVPEVKLGYIPGFDGVRGFLLPAILIYHHGFDVIPGGFFLLSLFFTLSGFLIASLVLAEYARTGRVSLAGFWERRARRLFPAALVTLVGIVVLEHWFGVGAGPRFKGDVAATFAYGANWRMASAGSDYSEMFHSGTPIQHFWSLAVEEQFYLTFPLLFMGFFAVLRGRWRAAGTVFAVGGVGAFALAWATAAREGSNSGLAYYATYTRASEILFGVVLAFVLVATPVRRFLASRRGMLLAGWLGFVGLAGQAWLWFNVDLSDAVVFRGGTILNSLLAAFVIVACTNPHRNLVARFLGIGVLCAFGRLTYGVYLIHWPVYLFLDAERTGLGTWPLFVVRVSVTIVLAVLSYHYLESPFRSPRRVSRRVFGYSLGGTSLALVAFLVFVPARPSDTVDLSEIRSDTPLTPDVVVPDDDAVPAARILLVGDSVSWSTLNGFLVWNDEHPDRQVHVDMHLAVSCGVASPAPVRSLGGIEEPFDTCTDFRRTLPEGLDRARYDAIVVIMGQRDLADRRIDGEWRHPGDPVFDRWYRPEVDELADLLATEGAPVLWATATNTAIVAPGEDPDRWRDHPENDPARARRLNELFRAELEGRPGFSLLDLQGWLSGVPGGVYSDEYRGDGAHYTRTGAAELGRWMVPQILAGAGSGPTSP